MKAFGVIGDGNHDCDLYWANTLSEAKRWIDGYTRWGDWGGYHLLEIYSTECMGADPVLEHSMSLDDDD
jgi:hypothetical protein